MPIAYRPPNPGPNVQALVVAALHPERELTLLGQRTHAASESETLDSAVDLDIHSKPKLNVTTVTALSGRESEVDNRLRSFLGSPEPEPAGSGWRGDGPSATPADLPTSTPWAPSPSPPRSRSPTESLSSQEPDEETQVDGEDEFPSTQDMGTSSLGSEYARPPRPATPPQTQSGTLLLQAPPLLGLTQQQRDEFNKREARQRRRHAIAASQIEECEPNEGGFHRASQAPRESVSPGASPRKPFSPVTNHSPFRPGGGTRDPGCLPKPSGSAARRRAIFAALGS